MHYVIIEGYQVLLRRSEALFGVVLISGFWSMQQKARRDRSTSISEILVT